MEEIALALRRARIPGLLAGRVSETGFAELITACGVIPIRLGATHSGIEIRAAVAQEDAGETVSRYVGISAQTCAWKCDYADGRLWVSLELERSSSIVQRVEEFCRLARQIADGAGWLAADDAAGRHWTRLADAAAKANERR